MDWYILTSSGIKRRFVTYGSVNHLLRVIEELNHKYHGDFLWDKVHFVK